jgi:hypothetical protein
VIIQLWCCVLLQQLIHVVADHRTSKRERVQALKRLLREISMTQYPVVKVPVSWLCNGAQLDLPVRIRISLQALADSSVLPHVSDDTRRDFIAKLTTEWLPDKRFELLYRGSRDGMTAAAFHDKCDDEGPTLVLVAGQSARKPVCVFGGYAGKSWERGPDSGEANGIDSCDSFLFTVLNPWCDGSVKMPVNEGSRYAGEAMQCHAGRGPWFNGGFVVKSSSAASTAVFDEWSFCGLYSGFTFGDPLGRGSRTLTGAECFTPLEVEVWSVC